MTETKKKPDSILKLVVILTAVSAIVALVLGLTNFITVDRIEALRIEKTNAAMREVLDCESYDELSYTGGDSAITGAYKAGDKGYVLQVSVSGSQGMIDMVIGVNSDMTVSGVSIVGMKETSGLGTKANDANWRAQFVGTAGNLSVNKDGGTIDALTGATVTSRAVTNGVNAAVEAAKTLG